MIINASNGTRAAAHRLMTIALLTLAANGVACAVDDIDSLCTLASQTSHAVSTQEINRELWAIVVKGDRSYNDVMTEALRRVRSDQNLLAENRLSMVWEHANTSRILEALVGGALCTLVLPVRLSLIAGTCAVYLLDLRRYERTSGEEAAHVQKMREWLSGGVTFFKKFFSQSLNI